MAKLVIEYRVADYDDWKEMFDRDPMGRGDHGVRGHAIHVDPDDRNHFLLAMDFDSTNEARRFRDLPAFQQVWDVSGAGASWILEGVEAMAYGPPVPEEPPNHFLYKLIPPRPTFPGDMTAAEGSIMEAHFGYWGHLIAERRAVAYGPVMDPRGTYGIAVVEVTDEAAAREMAGHDPAIQAKAGFDFEILPMSDAMVRP